MSCAGLNPQVNHYFRVQQLFNINCIALREAKIVYNFGLSKCNMVKDVISYGMVHFQTYCM